MTVNICSIITSWENLNQRLWRKYIAFYSASWPISNRVGCIRVCFLWSMELWTYDLHKQKEHTELYKVLKNGVNRDNIEQDIANNRPLALRGHVTNASSKQWVGILLMPKIDRAHKNYLTPEIWDGTHLREMFYGTLIF